MKNLNLPTGWEEKTFDNVAMIIMGQSPNSKFYNDTQEGLPLIQGNADCLNRKTNPKTWTTQVTKTCNIDDILMSVRAPVGSIAISKHKACIGRGFGHIKVECLTLY